MENIKIKGEKNSPGVDFNFQSNIFDLVGECYMEDADGFFKPIMEKFAEHLSSLDGAEIVFTVRLTYFNSSSARFIMRAMDQLDATAKQGNKVSIIWHFAEGDDIMEEHGEEFGEDLEYATFEMKQFAK